MAREVLGWGGMRGVTEGRTNSRCDIRMRRHGDCDDCLFRVIPRAGEVTGLLEDQK